MLRPLCTLIACLAAACLLAGPAAAATPSHSSRTTARAHRRARRTTRRRACYRTVKVRGRRHRVRRTVRCNTRRRTVTSKSARNTSKSARNTCKSAKSARNARNARSAKKAASHKRATRRHRRAATAAASRRRRRPAAAAARSADVGSAVQPHIETWAYDDGCNGGSGAGTPLVQQWLSYAETNCGPGGDAKGDRDCHTGGVPACRVIQYLDTNWIFQTGSPTWQPFRAAASESWYLHAPGSSTRITNPGYGGGYLINQSNPAVQSFFRNYVRSNYDGDDGLMMDDQSPSLSQQLYYATCGCRTTSELGSNGGLDGEHSAISGAMTHSSGQPFLQIDNALQANPYLPQGFDLLNRSSGVNGLIAEGVPESNGTLTPYYSTLLDDMAYVSARTSSFLVPLSYAPAGAPYQAQARRVQEATMLLGYSSGHLVDWADLEVGSPDLAVWPEEGIYPTQPVQSMSAPGGNGCLAGDGQICSTGGHNDLEVAPGVYRREFADCYNHGAAFGACATIVNTTGGPVTVRSSWLSHPYGHQITFAGGDVQSGGTINLGGASFSAGSSVVGAHDAVILAGS